MSKLKVCIASEGNRDKEVLDVLVRRIFSYLEIDIDVIKIVTPGTGLIGYMKTYVPYFFNVISTDIALFITDQDVPKERDNREKHMYEEISKVDTLLLDKCAVGVPDPHLEKWLLSDQEAVIKVFHLPGDQRIPGSRLPPKDRLYNLRGNMNPMLSEVETYTTLANKMKISNVLRSDVNFKRFVYKIKNIV